MRRSFQNPYGWSQSQPTLTGLNKRMYVSDGSITYSSGDSEGSGSSHGLSTGDIVGIVVGCLAAACALIIAYMNRGWIKKTMKKIFCSNPTHTTQPSGGVASPPHPPGPGANQSHGTGPPMNDHPQPVVSQNAPHQTAGGIPGPHTAGNAAH